MTRPCWSTIFSHRRITLGRWKRARTSHGEGVVWARRRVTAPCMSLVLESRWCRWPGFIHIHPHRRRRFWWQDFKAKGCVFSIWEVMRDWWTDWLVNWLVGWMGRWVGDWLIDRLIGTLLTWILSIFFPADSSSKPRGPTTKAVFGACVDPFSEYRIASYYDDILNIWDLRSLEKPIANHESRKTISQIQWSPTRYGLLALTFKDSADFRLLDVQHAHVNRDEYDPVLLERTFNGSSSFLL